MNKQISLRIHSVKCVDETNGRFVEKAGNDEIKLSGFGIDALANTVQVRPFTVNSNFDDGETQRYSPPKKFVTLSLANTTSFPKTCSVGFLLAEIDSGDFGTKAGQIFAKLTEEIEKKKKEEAKKKAQAMKTGSAALTGAEIAIVWELAKPFVFKFIKDKIIGAANDDMFPPKDVSVTVPSADFTFGGKKDSKEFPVEFRGHSGVYRMTCDWELS